MKKRLFHIAMNLTVLLLICSISFAQQAIKGTLQSASGAPLAGATVIIKGTTQSVVSDENGEFSINAPAGSTLVISYVGYSTQEIKTRNQSAISVTLQPSAGQDLNEVVVIGYGAQRKSDLTGAVATISTTDLRNEPIARIDQAIQGRSAGVVVQNNTAAPNGQVTIRVRGSNSINGANDPLIVIDGFIGGDLSSINPNEIRSIEVLKDASSTAIYGSRGANGVILISTKKGTSGKTTVQYNSYLSFTSVRKKLNLLSAAEYAETVNANRTDIGVSPVYTTTQINNFKANGGTDWQDQIFRKALQQSHQVSISGGGPNVLYYLSGNFINNDGIIKNTSFRQYSLRSNIESMVNSKIKIGVNLFLARSEDHPTPLNGFANGSPIFASTLWAPTLPVYDANGNYTLPSSQVGPPTVYNPLALAIEPITKNIRQRTEFNPFIEYTVLKGLTARISGGARFVNDENSFYNNTKPQAGTGTATAGITNNKFVVLQNTNQLSYQTTIANQHSINLTGVYEQQFEQFNSSFAGSSGFLTDALTYNNLGVGNSPQIPFSAKTTKTIKSYLGRAAYSFREKYLLSFSGRYDGASVFGENHKWGFFPSGALAWRVDKEEFMKTIDKISSLKVRTSYGITGSQAVGPYSSLSTLNTASPYAINGTSLSTGIGLGNLGNPDLKWEKTAQFDAGIDLGLFSERIQVTADYYHKKTTDLLLNVPVPLTSGYATVLKNIGAVENKGFEFNLGGSPFIGRFKWNTNLNFAINKNKVVSLANGAQEIPLGGPGLPNFGNTVFLVVGQPLGVFKGYIQDGTWSSAEAAKATSYGTIPGAPKYVDQDNNNTIDSKDIAIMGNAYPKFTYGWSNTVSFENFDLNVFVQGSRGNKIYNLSRVRSERASSDADATDARILNRWTPQNEHTDVPSFLGSQTHEQLQSSRWLENGSYLRVKNITLGYTLPRSILNRAKISSLRAYITGYNLFTSTKYTGYDPEASSGVDTFGGIDLATYPSQKSITIGLNITL